MPTPQWCHQPSLIRQLIDQPQRFQFFQAVRVIDLWLRHGTPAHGRTLDSVLRFKNSVSLNFPPSQIEALSIDTDAPVSSDAALQDALDHGQLRHVHITPAFMGFLGVNGVLPYYYTETIAAQIHVDKNHGGRAFFDTFSHRSMTLFYRAWAHSHVEYRTDEQGRDGFLALQLALAGKPARAADAAPVNLAEGELPDEVAAHYAALIRHRPMTADMIAGVLAEYFGVPFRLQTFVGAWETLAPDERTQLRGNNKLGFNAMLGSRYWCRNLCARLWVGPLPRADFDRFLKAGDCGKALKSMLTLFATVTMRFEVRLILRATDITPVRLDASKRLGHGAFLVHAPPARDRADTGYLIAF